MKKKKEYRHLVKEALRDKLGKIGFTGKYNFFKMTTHYRTELSFELYDTYFEVLIVEHPIKEGWSKDTFKYEYRNINRATHMVRWF